MFKIKKNLSSTKVINEYSQEQNSVNPNIDDIIKNYSHKTSTAKTQNKQHLPNFDDDFER